ncbi:MAG TPA: Gfo/Idh/MocA family oxidoreductase, partial [Gaiellaceae bacterium]
VACSDTDSARSDALAAAHGLRVEAVDELIGDPAIDIVLNLTPPEVHAAVVGAALDAGKHVYTEKPLTTSVDEGRALLAEAERRKLRIGCAPDTFLGSAYDMARELIARGDIGEPLGADAKMLVGGADTWHPNGDMFFRTGAGPMLDIAPYYLTAIAALLGPFAEATGFGSTPTPTRTLAVGPRAGEIFAVEVPTHVTAALRLVSGALATLTVSFEARDQYESGLVVFGTEGVLVLPDANQFEGELRMRIGGGEWRPVEYRSRGAQETRGYGLHEMIEAVRAERPHRASGELALHVLETASAVVRSAEEGRTVEIATRLAAA